MSMERHNILNNPIVDNVNTYWSFVWIDVSTPPECGRVLTFSPCYEVGHAMRFRIMDSQFVRISKEVTHWMDLEAITPENVELSYGAGEKR